MSPWLSIVLPPSRQCKSFPDITEKSLVFLSCSRRERELHLLLSCCSPWTLYHLISIPAFRLNLLKIKDCEEVREKAQWFRVLDTPAEDLSLVPSIDTVTHSREVIQEWAGGRRTSDLEKWASWNLIPIKINSIGNRQLKREEFWVSDIPLIINHMTLATACGLKKGSDLEHVPRGTRKGLELQGEGIEPMFFCLKWRSPTSC